MIAQVVKFDVLEIERLTHEIGKVFSPDPYLPAPDPETLQAAAVLVLLMAQVSRTRPQRLAREPWKQRPAHRHLEHALLHAEKAFLAVDANESEHWLDPNSGLPNAAHAALRLAFACVQVARLKLR